MPSWLTVKASLYAGAVLLLALGAQSVRLHIAQADLRAVVAEKDALEIRVDAHKLSAANANNRAAGYELIANERLKLLVACQKEGTRLRAENDEAIAAARRRAADAERLLGAWIAKYADAIRNPDCAAARQRLDQTCSIGDY